MLEYFNNNPEMFILIFLGIAVFNVLVFLIGGSIAEKGFPDLNNVNLKFRQKNASGYSTKSVLTKFGGARGVLDVVVTEEFLIIKGMFPFFSFITAKYGLLHKVDIANIIDIVKNGKNIEIKFNNGAGTISDVVLILNDPDKFISVLSI